MTMAVFWVLTLYSLAEVNRRCFLLITLMMKAASTSETCVNFYRTTRRNNQKTASHLQFMQGHPLQTETRVVWLCQTLLTFLSECTVAAVRLIG
jgi:hypothetical protein